jgi:hypothetical protein
MAAGGCPMVARQFMTINTTTAQIGPSKQGHISAIQHISSSEGWDWTKHHANRPVLTTGVLLPVRPPQSGRRDGP